MSARYFDPATGEWVTRGELARRRYDGPPPQEIWPAWLEAKEPQEVEVVESGPLTMTEHRLLQSSLPARDEAARNREYAERLKAAKVKLLREYLIPAGRRLLEDQRQPKIYDWATPENPAGIPPQVDDQGEAKVVELTALPPPEGA